MGTIGMFVLQRNRDSNRCDQACLFHAKKQSPHSKHGWFMEFCFWICCLLIDFDNVVFDMFSGRYIAKVVSDVQWSFNYVLHSPDCFHQYGFMLPSNLVNFHIEPNIGSRFHQKSRGIASNLTWTENGCKGICNSWNEK
eukprot:PhF_6_TR32193/c0_g1_i3/m.47830